MRSPEDLEQTLTRIDGRGYKAYADIHGGYDFGDVQLFVDHVQGDPFASPSKIRVRLPLSVARIPAGHIEDSVRRVAIRDYLARIIAERLRRAPGAERQGLGNSGRVYIDAGGQEVLDRSAVKLTANWVEARLEVGLPAAGRRILGRAAARLLLERLPDICRSGLIGTAASEDAAGFVQCIENQEAIRGKLREIGAVAFVADGAILPRRSGVSDRPLPAGEAVPFQSPASMRVTIGLPNPPDANRPGETAITGMVIRKGVTLIAGGGYHGKSTLLRALERCVYAHVPGDGREYVVTDSDAVKIRAEDRRRIEKVDVSGFIGGLPNGQDTAAFSTGEASGSTSQAAAIVEALESGASALLIDEDTSATNLMVRDARMQALVMKANEPITPLIDRVRELFDRFALSTIMVMGGSGDYFEAADQVIVMRNYLPEDASREAKRIAAEFPVGRRNEAPAPFSLPALRRPDPESIDPSRGRKRIKIDVSDVTSIRFGRETIDLRAVEQLVDRSQTRSVGFALYRLAELQDNGGKEMSVLLDELEERIDREGLEYLDPYMRTDAEEREHPGNLAIPRRHEIAAALNRLRSLRINR